MQFDAQVIETVSKVAGIGGLSIGLLLLVFRQIIAKNIFPQLAKAQAFRIVLVIAVLSWTIALAGIGAWTFIEYTKIRGAAAVTHEPIETGQVLVEEWVLKLKEARKKRIIHRSSPIPGELQLLRAKFEAWWRNASLSEKQSIDAKILYQALSWNARLYRIYEVQDELKASASYWIEQTIDHYTQIQDVHYLVESLLDKGALFLELSQIEHTEPDSWRRIAAEGDAVMTRTAELASNEQKSSVYRIWSRFYYNLARPRDGMLSKTWDNNALAQAYEKAKSALDNDPDELKNATQLSRTTQKAAANPPNDTDTLWTARLREAQKTQLKLFREKNEVLKSPYERIPPLNILAVMTMEVGYREARDSGFPPALLQALNQELEDVSIKSQREALALLTHTEWSEDYDFDMRYDLARMQLLQVQFLDRMNDPKADKLFPEALQNLQAARQAATSIQLDAAKLAIDSDPIFVGLSEVRKAKVAETLS